MNVSEQLIKDGIISEEQSVRISNFERDKAMTVHWELKTILYLGILLFMTGLGILVYLNIDTIGHTVIIGAIAAGSIACFYYGLKKRKPYSHEEIKHESPLYDYVVLLGCLLFGVFITYMQFQYSVFGLHYGLATILPAILYFVTAYLFDHKGILSLGITGLAAWAGISITPMHLLEDNDFSSEQIIFASVAVGLILAGFSKWADMRGIKKHFGFTYNNFGSNIMFIACLAYLFNDSMPIRFIAFPMIAGLTYYYIRYAIAEKSFLFLLLAVLYGYIALTYMFFIMLFQFDNKYELAFMLGMFYIIASCAGIVLFFIYYKRILGIKR
jgi:hypothetical protein